MKRNAKQNGSGGRLRWALLLASAAAFLLVPAAAASAAALNVDISGTGDGEVITSTDPFYAELQSTPPIVCEYVAPGPQSGTCDAVAASPEAPNVARLVAEPAPGSVFKEWDVGPGVTEVDGCGESLECGVLTSGATPIVVEATFEKEPNVHISIAGSGSGTVNSEEADEELEGTPPLNCHYTSPGPATGTCDNVNGTAFGGALPGIQVEQEADAGSVFVEWIVEEGEPGGVDCFPGEATCTVFFPEPGIKIKAVFAELPKFNLTVTESGTGTGTVTSSPAGINCGVDCNEEYTAGTLVTLTGTPATGSDPVVWESCPGTVNGENKCEVTMDAAKEAVASFELKTFALTLNPSIGSGTLTAECDYGSGLEACASLTEIPYNTGVEVTATPDPLNSVASLTGSNSASVCSIAGVGPEEAATCEFDITADSEVTAEFVDASSIATHPVNVFGTVDQQTTLETEDCDDVDLGPFVPSATEVSYANDECVVTVTATGAENQLRAADEEVIVPNGTNLTGHLTQEPASPFTLNKALEVKGTGTTGGATPNPSALQPLSSTAILQDYGTPVSLDVVTVEFRQLIEAFEPLHTGTYDKTITLTLEQTVL